MNMTKELKQALLIIKKECEDNEHCHTCQILNDKYNRCRLEFENPEWWEIEDELVIKL